MKHQTQTNSSIMHRYIFIFLLLCTSLGFGQKLTLEQCIAIALEKNISIKQADLEVENAKVGQSDARSAFLPSILITPALAAEYSLPSVFNTFWTSGGNELKTPKFIQTIIAETIDTPPNDAIWIIDGLRYCEIPKKFHGNPVNNWPLKNSNETHKNVNEIIIWIFFNKLNPNHLSKHHLAITPNGIKNNAQYDERNRYPNKIPKSSKLLSVYLITFTNQIKEKIKNVRPDKKETSIVSLNFMFDKDKKRGIRDTYMIVEKPNLGKLIVSKIPDIIGKRILRIKFFIIPKKLIILAHAPSHT